MTCWDEERKRRKEGTDLLVVLNQFGALDDLLLVAVDLSLEDSLPLIQEVDAFLERQILSVQVVDVILLLPDHALLSSDDIILGSDLLLQTLILTLQLTESLPPTEIAIKQEGEVREGEPHSPCWFHWQLLWISLAELTEQWSRPRPASRHLDGFAPKHF
jgi:hypothetical protein